MTLRIQLLGPVNISRGKDTIRIPGHRPLALLAYLVVTGKPHSRQHLVDLFFFDGPDDPRAALRWTLSKLRKAIGADFILADRQQIAFDFDNDYWLDVTAFEENGEPDLYRGDFLEGLYVRDAPGFEDWAFYERERLRDRYQVALEQRLAKHENQGDDLAAIEAAHHLLRMDNLREDWYRYLMRAYARIGKRDAALTQFRRCQQVLRAELGVEPAVETTGLAEVIQQGRLETAHTGLHRGSHRIAARFTIGDLERSLISESSMSRVYQGVDTQTGQPVAIKIVKPGIIASQPNVIKRFVQEGQVLRRLDHPNVVKMLAALEQGGQHYLILEYVEGGSLRDLLDAQGALPLDQAARIIRDLADGLGEAHRLNVIHRDLKPTNVLLAEDGTPRLTDFGIALTDGGSRLTSPGIVVGTVDYLSPEACQGENLDARTDIWALGVLLFEMLTNHRPFVGDTLTAILAAILTQPTPELTQFRPDVPSALADLVYGMLAKDPHQRVSSAHLVGDTMEAILTGQKDVRVPGLPVGGAPAASPPKKTRSGRVLRDFPTPLVGRTTEMEVLRHVWQRAAEGSGQMVLVKGEPGVGKTRLLEELLAEVAGEAIILRATCHELHEPLTYTLFIDPLRQALAGERPKSLSDTQLTEICRLLPELTECFPDLPRPVPLDAAAERRRLFDAIGATLVALATRLPLVFLVDDLQWADPTSLAVLNHLSAQIVEAPVLIVGAYRPHEVDSEHPLRKTRRVWERAGLLTSLALDPLTEEAVAALLGELTTWTGDHPSFGRLIYRETKGNPLFVVETVASLRDQGRLPQSAEGWRRDFDTEKVAVPSRVQTIIEARLDRLDGLSRQIAAAASVMRGSFAAEVIQAVSGRNELETLEGLERLLTGGLLVEEETGRFTFSHHNIRAVVYQGISQLRSKLLHRRMAEILEKRHRGQESAVAERLAYHYEQADVQDKALEYYLQAGRNARELYAHETAIGHYQRALVYLEQQGDYERAARTWMQLGLTFHNAFDFQQARQAYERGFALWQRVGQLQPITSLPPAPHALRLIECDPPTLDPTMGGDAASVSVIIQLFSGLVETSPEMDVLPDVAQSWEVLEGGRRYVFHLRTDVRWSDGVPVSAEDFEYAWRRVLAPTTGSSVAGLFYDIEGAEAFHRGKVSDPDCVGVRALDEHTLVVELAKPTGYFLHLVTCSAFCPVPRHVVEAHGEAWTAADRIVTNGPFRLEVWDPGKSIVMVRNPEYHGRFTGNVQRVELDLSTDRPSRLEMYEADALDVLTESLDALGLQPAVMDRIRQRYAEECLSGPVLNTRYIGFDTSRPPFDDARVRQAFALAIDREVLADVVLRGYVSPATGGLVPPGMPGHLAGGGLPYDPGQARRLLSEAGYPDGRSFPATDGLIPLGSVPAVIGEYLQTRWRENLGVEIEWETVDWAAFLDRLYGEPPHLHLNIWLADYADPDSFLRGCLQQTAASIGWRDKAFADLVDKARRVTDQGERMKLYQQADKILMDEAVIVPLDHSRSHLLVKPWVRKFPSSVLGRRFWKDVVLEPH